MVFNVALIGHSQLPFAVDSHDDIVYTVFRKPGATTHDLEFSPLNQVFTQGPFNLIIFFIGGNDVVQYKNDPLALVHMLRSCLFKLKAITSKVVFANLENREYAVDSRFDITTDEYMSVAKKVNRILFKFCAKQHIHTLHTSNPRFFGKYRSDGVHFDHEARLILIEKFKTCAIRAKESTQ